eukprot:10840419-Karenia_brevis.AAC.1
MDVYVHRKLHGSIHDVHINGGAASGWEHEAYPVVQMPVSHRMSCSESDADARFLQIQRCQQSWYQCRPP